MTPLDPFVVGKEPEIFFYFQGSFWFENDILEWAHYLLDISIFTSIPNKDTSVFRHNEEEVF